MSKADKNVIAARSREEDRVMATAARAKRWIGSPHPLDAEFGWFAGVRWHDFASCYVWRDCAVYDALGEVIGYHRGNTIYLDRGSDHVLRDLVHEVGHAVGRHFNRVGHRDNHYSGEWDRRSQRLIGAVGSGRHWSGHLNGYAAGIENFSFNAASEIWAELFMLFYLYPDLPETNLIEAEIDRLRREPSFGRVEAAVARVLPGR